MRQKFQGPNAIADGATEADGGFVLVTVLGVLLILALMASSVLLSSRTLVKLRAASAIRTELEAIADGAVRFATVRVAQPDGAAAQANALPLDGTPVWCRDDTTAVRLEISDVAGLIDLNLAPVEILEILISGLGVAREDAHAIAASIASFRGGGRSPIAATPGQLPKATLELPFGPKNAPFESVDELDQVAGMSPELLALLRPFVTVHNKSPAIDTSIAPLALLQALTLGGRGDQQGGAAAVPTDRSQFQAPRQLQTRSNPRANLRSRRRTFAVQVLATRGEEASFLRRAVIEVAPQAETGLQVHEWLSPALPADAPRNRAIPGSLAPCF